MICPRCGAQAPNGKKFCADCGSALPISCPACGAPSTADKRFCADCGAALGQTEASQRLANLAVVPLAERRHLTVMFADLVGSTALSARLDPEDLREVIAGFHNCIAGLVTRYGGFVARYLGDGMLVYFGYPQAHEDDPERAVRTGLAIVEAVRRLETVAGPPGTLSARVGIATGLVVVGDVIGSGSSLESQVVGDTPNLAARLQAHAEPGAVVIAETTRKLTGGLFDYRELPPAHLKGIPAPVRAWAVEGENPIDSRFEALHAGRLPIVDRIEELDLLLRRWQQAKTGQGRVVLLCGDAGIGKSRLIAALEQRVSGEARARRYLCWPHYQETAFYPLIRQLERVAGFERGDNAATKSAKLVQYLSTGAWSDTQVALFLDLMSLPQSKPELLESLLPQRRKEMIFDMTVRQFDHLAQKGPVLTILEDIHWADPTTMDLLDTLVEAIARLPILLVVTARPEVRPSWATRPHVTVQLLNALPRSYAVSLINEVASTTELPDDVVERIAVHADGVPLFIEELTKTVIDSGSSRSGGEGISKPEVLSPDLVPATLQASLMERLDRLSSAKEVAQIGSVIGREFPFDLLQMLTGHNETRLSSALDELVQSGLAVPRGKPPDATYTFKHALMQDAAYESMLRARRRAIHLQLAEHLEQDTSSSTEPQLIAWHFAQASVPDRAIDYYLKAAERATGRFALGEMVSLLREGLNQLERLPDSTATRRRELALQVALGRAMIDHRGGGAQEVRVTFERARDLCLMLGETKQLLRVHDGLVNHHITQLDLKKVLQYAGEMHEVGQQTGDSQALVMAHRSAGIANLLLGRLEKSREEAERFSNFYDAERDAPRAALAMRDPMVSNFTTLGICLTLMGHLEAGAKASHEGVSHAERLNHGISLTLGLRRACVRAMVERDVKAALTYSERLVGIATEYETFKGSLDGTIFHCWAKLQVEFDDALLKQMLGCIEQFDSAKNWVMLPFYMACAAELMGRQGNLASAAALLDRAAELTGVTGEQWYEAEIIRLQAWHSDCGFDDAVALLQSSLGLSRKQSARLLELRVATTLADLLQQHGKHAEAHEVLMPIYSWFPEGSTAPDLISARSVLDKLAVDFKDDVRSTRAPSVAS